jgi:Spy/CpxP family protein refolding chaperone
MKNISHALRPLSRVLLAASIAGAVFAAPVAASAQEAASESGHSSNVRRGRGARPAHAVVGRRGDAHRVTPERRAARTERRIERMARFLELTEEQKNQVAAVVTEAATARRALMQETEPGPARREAMRSLRNSMKERLRAVLTAEQNARLEARRAARAERVAARRADRSRAMAESRGPRGGERGTRARGARGNPPPRANLGRGQGRGQGNAR